MLLKNVKGLCPRIESLPPYQTMPTLVNSQPNPDMEHQAAFTLLFYYGTFLILCGIASVIFIGMKAKTALASGGISGIAAMSLGHLLSTGANAGFWGGVLLSFILFCVFSWRSTKTLFALFELIPSRHEDVKGKGIAFLIISLMGVVSIMVFFLLLIQS